MADDATTLRQIRRHDNNMMIPIPPNGPIETRGAEV
jgi:hypothetical protein